MEISSVCPIKIGLDGRSDESSRVVFIGFGQKKNGRINIFLMESDFEVIFYFLNFEEH